MNVRDAHNGGTSTNREKIDRFLHNEGCSCGMHHMCLRCTIQQELDALTKRIAELEADRTADHALMMGMGISGTYSKGFAVRWQKRIHEIAEVDHAALLDKHGMGGG